MKRLLIIICTLLLSIGSWAKEVKIELLIDTTRNAFERSLSTALSASINNNIIYLYSEVLLEELKVTVKNESGEILSSEYVSIFPQQPYTFFIGNVENGVYIVELDDGKYKYQGYFEISQ